MSDLPPEEVGLAVESVPVWLPKSLAALNRQQLAQWVIDALRGPQNASCESSVVGDEQP